ncbi:beta-ketoacyl synthase N-terminal-like domain-containing protein, partial [Klebsiella pneumoniae]
MSRRRVVITGLGIISPVGNSVSEAWTSLTQGKSGISTITRFETEALTAKIAG